jgi:26S proteasome regulatory subunit N1
MHGSGRACLHHARARVARHIDTPARWRASTLHAGFQTHTTPVLMNAGERAELGTEKYLPLSPILEGIVILKPNPDYVEVTE